MQVVHGHTASSLSNTFSMNSYRSMQLHRALPEEIIAQAERRHLISALERISVLRNWASVACFLPSLEESLGLRDAAISMFLSLWDNPTMRQNSNEEISRWGKAFVK